MTEPTADHRKQAQRTWGWKFTVDELAHLLADADRLREELADAADYEKAFNNACIHAEIDLSYGLDVREEKLVSLVKAKLDRDLEDDAAANRLKHTRALAATARRAKKPRES